MYLSAGCLQTELPYRKCRACRRLVTFFSPLSFSNDFLSHTERYEITVSFHAIVKINWKRNQTVTGHCLFLHKPPWRYNFLSFECVKRSNSINAVMFYIDREIKLNEIHFQTVIICFFFFCAFHRQSFRFRSMIRIKEAITFMKHSFQSMSVADSLQIERVLFIYLSVVTCAI